MNLHSTGDTYNFSTKPICPSCGREIPTDNIVADKDSAWCPACQREMSFTDVADYSLVKTVKGGSRLSAKLTVKKDKKYLKI